MRGGIFGGVGLVVLAVIAAIFYFSFFIVDMKQQALVLRFGDPIRVVTTPGLNFKVPLIDNVVYIEKRVLDLDSPALEVIASDQKRLVVDAFGRYKITNPLLFYQTVGTEAVADSRLSVILNSAVRRVLGDASFIDVVKNERDDLMERISTQVNQEGLGLGVQVVDVKIRRADLPEANSQAIYQRMQTERQREATEIRALGEQASRRIRAEADRDVTVIIANANKTSEQVRGDGEASLNRIFADAFGRDAEFFAFYRSMQAYRQGLQNNDTRMVLSPDSTFFRFFNDPFGAGSADGEGAPGEATQPAGGGVSGLGDDGAADTEAGTQALGAPGRSGAAGETAETETGAAEPADDLAPVASDGAAPEPALSP